MGRRRWRIDIERPPARRSPLFAVDYPAYYMFVGNALSFIRILCSRKFESDALLPEYLFQALLYLG